MKFNLTQKIIFIATTSFSAIVALCLWYFVLARGNADRLRSVDTAVALTNGGDPHHGYKLILTYGCGACHEIPGIPGASGKIGATLKDFNERSTIAGVLPNTANNLIRWVQHPREVEPKTAMPELGVSEKEARDIAAYLYFPL